jgi:pimeloyl-ACP methyl ester carboxylesterase
VHGNGCAHEDWDPQIEFFRGRHEVITPDLRGHGASADAPGPFDLETLGDATWSACSRPWTCRPPC